MQPITRVADLGLPDPATTYEALRTRIEAWTPMDLFGKVHPTSGYIRNGATVIVTLLGMVMLFGIAWQGYRWIEGTRIARTGAHVLNDARVQEGKSMQQSAIVSAGLIAATAFILTAAWKIGAGL
jgi:hypothetical protein